MTLEEIQNKMKELSVSYGYLASCCGVSLVYIKQCIMGSKPMTKPLRQKIEGVFHTLLITPKQAKEIETKEPVVIRRRRKRRTFVKNDEKQNCLKNLICKYGEDFGCSIHTLEFERDGYNYSWTLEIKEVEE